MIDLENPFPGLRPFDADESHLFFGRESATAELLYKLRNNRFIAVVGTSGSGKSSLVRAGVLPDVYGGFMAGAGSHWRVAVFRPSDRPIHELALALASPDVLSGDDDIDMAAAIAETVLRRGAFGLVDVVRQARLPQGTNLLVVVDQFEELFRLRSAVLQRVVEDEAAAFVKLLLEAARQTELPIYVMLTMRSEYLGDCTRFRDLPEAINKGQYLIPRMTRAQRREAITGPVAVGGASIAPPLVQRLLNDVGDNPDQLPIMQHAMMRTWSIWAGEGDPSQPIDLAHYEATGGMAEALSRHADEAYDELADGESRAIARRIFQRLTGRGADNREMRYPATLEELCKVTGANRDRVVAVIEAFRRPGRSFLTPPANVPLTDHSLIDISHESLIRIWKRLRKWVERETNSARIYTRLAETSELHHKGEAGLWRNPDLQIALNWRRENQPNAAWAERYHGDFGHALTFLDASRRALRRRRLATIATPIALVAVVVGMGYFRMFEWASMLDQKVTMLDQNLQLLQDRQVEAEEAAAQAEDRLAAAKAELQQTQIKISEAREKLARAQENQAQQERTTVQVRDQLNERVVSLRGALGEAQAPGGDKALVEGLELALSIAQAQARTVESIDAAGASGSSAAEAANDVRELENIERELAASVEKLQELEAAEPTAGATLSGDVALEPEAVSYADLAAVEGGAVAGEFHTVAESSAAVGGSAADPALDSEVEAPALVQTASCVAATTLDSTLLARRTAWQQCAEQSDSPQEVALAESELAQLEESFASSAAITSPDNFLTCQSVEALECVGATDTFDPGRVYVFARVVTPADATLRLDWLKQGQPYRSGTLNVRQNTTTGFRTYTWKGVHEPGPYQVLLFNGRGELIGERSFDVR